MSYLREQGVQPVRSAIELAAEAQAERRAARARVIVRAQTRCISCARAALALLDARAMPQLDAAE